MKGNYLYIVFLLLFSLSFIDCAKRGNPEGGARDTIPPVILKAVPENYYTNFKGNEITIQFDEYIKLKDLQNQLIISPPLDNQPVITPFGTSKILKVVINDTLKENTTYTINFGSSIVDNNEDNSFDYFKYVFSTGTYIDSLKVLGTITDALNLKPDENITVMLYEINEQFTDSVVYKNKPLYVASSQSAPGYFSIENIKEGSYLLVGLKDNNSNYKFDPKVDKIGFLDEPISIPEDTTFNINLFKETPDYSMVRLSSSNRQKLQFGYEGNIDSVQIELLNTKPSGFEYVITKEKDKDTLNFWYTPKIETDSLSFKVSNRSKTDTLSVRLNEEVTDSLVVSPLKSGTLLLDEPFVISANNPISTIDKERIQIIDKDSVSVDFNTEYDSFHNTMSLLFKKEERQAYTIFFYPESITDFFGSVNDTIQFRTNTRSISDYGFLSLTLENVQAYPLIVQLVTESGEVRKKFYAEDRQTTFNFENILPGMHYVRIIYDTNKNRKWDTGSYQKKLQPEKVIYFPKLLDIRANWTLNETFVLE